MEEIRSRKSAIVQRIRELARDPSYRIQEKLFLCDGEKLLIEALRSDAEVTQVFWKGQRNNALPVFPEEYLLSEELFDFVSPMKNSPGPLFCVRLKNMNKTGEIKTVLLLEQLQDPGNVGTVLRTADAFGIDLVILLPGCADLYSPKTVRASMGAIFRQAVLQIDREEAVRFCREQGLPLYAAALSSRARDLRCVDLHQAAVAIGSEGHGLSESLKQACDGEIIIPMSGAAESLNAAMAATIVMWEMQR